MVLRFIVVALVLLLLTPGSVFSAFEPVPKARRAVAATGGVLAAVPGRSYVTVSQSGHR